jgi:hypothetical protein
LFLLIPTSFANSLNSFNFFSSKPLKIILPPCIESLEVVNNSSNLPAILFHAGLLVLIPDSFAIRYKV